MKNSKLHILIVFVSLIFGITQWVNAKSPQNVFTQTAENAFKVFQKEGLMSASSSLDFLFLKLEKKQNFKTINASDLKELHFDILTHKVLNFINRLDKIHNLPLNSKLRKEMQFEFYSLSQAIKKANVVSLTVNSDHFDKLHDMLMGQGLSLYYASSKDKKMSDLFFSSYYLHEIECPMDMTARHLDYLKKSSKYDDRLVNYVAKLARAALAGGMSINKLTTKQMDTLYEASFLIETSDSEKLGLQKMYLKQLQILGEQDKIKNVKRELASSILWQETKNLLSNPLDIFKYFQFCVGYIFIAWPLEMIVIFVSLSIFAFQASSVLTAEEKLKKSYGKKMWMVFQKAYLGSNVPFFTKLAASLILFGVGLYFNSAKNFVETMISNM